VATGLPVIREVKANPAGMSGMFWVDKIVVDSPKNKTYNVETVPVNFTVELLPGNSIYSRCILQNLGTGQNVTIELASERTGDSHEYEYYTSVFSQYTSLLQNLTDGTYVLTAQRCYQKLTEPDGIMVKTFVSVVFTIDTTPPDVSVLTLENKTYDTSDVPLSFTVNELASQFTYALDERGNETITGNTTLTGLSDGSHTLTVYAKDAAGNTGISKTITFNVQKPFSTTLVVTLVASAVVVSLGLIVYFTKIKKTTGKTEE
jgi:hypothetical protein